MINSLQGFRVILCILVFLFHVNSQVETSVLLFSGFGTLAVSYFFILSGFVHYLTYKPELTSKENRTKTFRRIISNYPLHWICLILMFPLRHSELSLSFKTAGRILVNASLLQSWIPIEKVCLDFNSSSWFLSDIIFMILLTVPLCKFVYNLNGKNKLLYLIFGIQIIEVLFSFILLDKDIQRILYFNPLVRIFDYFSGIMTAKLLKEYRISFKAKNFFEILVIVLILFLAFIYRFVPNSFSNAGTLYLIAGCFTIYVLALQQGFISSFFSKNLLIKLSKGTMYFYMVHHVVNINFKGFLLHTGKNVNTLIYYMIVLIGAFVMSFALYEVFKLYKERNRKVIKCE